MSSGERTASKPTTAPVAGGPTRQESARLGLESLSTEPPDRVLIHDGVRPLPGAALIGRVLEALDLRDAVLVGHSMGGLVARAACHYGGLSGRDWVTTVRGFFKKKGAPRVQHRKYRRQEELLKGVRRVRYTPVPPHPGVMIHPDPPPD